MIGGLVPPDLLFTATGPFRRRKPLSLPMVRGFLLHLPVLSEARSPGITCQANLPVGISFP